MNDRTNCPRRRALAIRTGACLALLAACGSEPVDDEPRYSASPEISAEGTSLHRYENLDDLAAASTYVVRGRVLSAGPGRSAGTPGEDLLTFRNVELEVLEVIKGATVVGERLAFEEEGYETDGTGYVMNGVQWSYPGDEGWYYFREGADGMLRLTSDHGRFSTKGGHLGPSGLEAREHGPWGDVTSENAARHVRESVGKSDHR